MARSEGARECAATLNVFWPLLSAARRCCRFIEAPNSSQVAATISSVACVKITLRKPAGRGELVSTCKLARVHEEPGPYRGRLHYLSRSIERPCRVASEGSRRSPTPPDIATHLSVCSKPPASDALPMSYVSPYVGKANSARERSGLDLPLFIHLSLIASCEYCLSGDSKYSRILREPVLISAVTAMPGLNSSVRPSTIMLFPSNAIRAT